MAHNFIPEWMKSLQLYVTESLFDYIGKSLCLFSKLCSKDTFKGLTPKIPCVFYHT
jgi:hypothetical protein